MRLFDDERVYAECGTCSWGCSGSPVLVDDRADTHEFENPGHKVKVVEVVKDE